METTERGTFTVRNLGQKDLEAVVGLDARITGRRREEYFRTKLRQSLEETGIRISLAAEWDGTFVGFLLARVYYGEFGRMEPAAVLDTIGVPKELRGKGIGRALVAQLATNLRGLGVPVVQTQVSWDDFDLLAFFRSEGFRPAPRFCLDLDLSGRPAE